MVTTQTLAAILGAAVALATFLGACLSRMKKIWNETAKQTWLLEQLTNKLTEHIDVVHREQDRRIRAVESRRRSS